MIKEYYELRDNRINSNIDSYPSMEFEKTRKAKSVGNTMGQFDIYLDEFIEKEKEK